MHDEEKQRQVERALRGIGKERSLSERKELQQLARERRANRRTKPRSGATQRPRPRESDDGEDSDEFAEYEDLESFETMRRAPGHLKTRGESVTSTAHDWWVVGLRPNALLVNRGQRERLAHLGGLRLDAGAPVVGDRVALQELAGGEARVRSVAPRASVLRRGDPGNPRAHKVLAANVDVALLCVDHGPRGLRRGLVERMRIAVEIGGIKPLVVITKVDLLDAAGRGWVDGFVREMQHEGVDALTTAMDSREGLERLQELAAGNVVVAVGQSGVGKSTLLNGLDPDHARVTGEVRAQDGRGRHTTTSSSMRPWGDGGWLIDTPGIRSFGLHELSAAEILACFPDLDALAAGCLKGCSHGDGVGAERCEIALACRSDPGLEARRRRYLRIVNDA